MIALLEGEYMRKRELTKKIKELKSLKAQDALLKEQIATIEMEVKEELDKRGVQEMIAGAYTIRYSDVYRQQLDTASFKQKYSDLYNQFAKAISYKRLTIS